MSPETAWEHLSSRATKIANLDHEEAIHLLHVYSHDPMARYQFHYYEGEPVVYPPPPEPPYLHRDDTNRTEYTKNVWQFACADDALAFVQALDDYWGSLGVREHVRVLHNAAQPKSQLL